MMHHAYHLLNSGLDHRLEPWIGCAEIAMELVDLRVCTRNLHASFVLHHGLFQLLIMISNFTREEET